MGTTLHKDLSGADLHAPSAFIRTQLDNIGTTNISTVQWGILGDLAETLTATELNYVDGVTSAIQTQLDAKVTKSLFDVQTILTAVSDDTPIALSVAEQTLIGRITAGNVTALTATQTRTLLNVEDGATADQTEAEILTLLGLTSVEVDQLENIGTTTISTGQWSWFGSLINLLNLTEAEAGQLLTIGTTTVSAGQWGYLGALTVQPTGYVSRVPATYDFDATDFSHVGSWQVDGLNVSSLVSSGAVAVHFAVEVKSTGANEFFGFRRSAADPGTVGLVQTKIANQASGWVHWWLACDSNRLFDYYSSLGGVDTGTRLSRVRILGWVIA